MADIQDRIDRDVPKQLIDIDSGEYFDEFMDDLKYWAQGSGHTLLRVWFSEAKGEEEAAKALRKFWKQWREAKAYELARENIIQC